MIATITNLIYLGAGAIAYDKDRLILSVSLVNLTLCSGMYHGLLWMGTNSLFWQNMDMASIYLVLGVLPMAITKRYSIDWIWLIPSALLILNKFGVLLPDFHVDSFVSVPVMAIPTLVYGWSRIKPDWYWTAIMFMVFAVVFNVIALQFKYDIYGYDGPHGLWHIESGIAFILIITGIKGEAK